MTTSRFEDRFDRADGEVGSAYEIPCGDAAIFDESVWPVAPEGAPTGQDAFEGTTLKKTQVLMIEELDSPDVEVRGVWSHLDSLPQFDLDIDQIMSKATQDPSFTLVARMTKDPQLVDLGTREDPLCYDQGYGLRVTCPRSGAAPILKLVKYSPRGLPPGVAGPTTPTEADGAYVLATKTLAIQNLNVDPSQDPESSDPPAYRGFVQSMKLRIRRTDDQAILEGYLNDRNQDIPIISFTDYRHPVWGKAGQTGFEFLSATSASQPTGASPFSETGIPVMACHLFLAGTVLDRSPAYASAPSNLMTYSRVVDRVIALVEKNGDARYTATSAGQTKRDIYLQFVLEAERDLIRKEGFWRFLWKERTIPVTAGVDTYEMPDSAGEIDVVNISGELYRLSVEEYLRIIAVSSGRGRPSKYCFAQSAVNNRAVIRLWPSPASDCLMTVGYYARVFQPDRPDEQLPHIPQEDIDVLIYGGAAHAMMLDTDIENAKMFHSIYASKVADLRQKNNRNLGSAQTVFRTGRDETVRRVGPSTRIPDINNLIL